jgi:hypothetical protein
MLTTNVPCVYNPLVIHSFLFSLVVHDSGYFGDLYTILAKMNVIGDSINFPHYLQ